MSAPRLGSPRDREVWVTGLGVVSALGEGCSAHWEALRAGRHGLRRIERFDTECFSCEIGGLWPGWAGRRQREVGPEIDLEACAADFPVAELAITAAREALGQAGLAHALEAGTCSPARVGLVLGTCFGQGFREFHELTERVAAAVGIRGPCLTVSTACASSANAIGIARDLLRNGECDAVLAGGADALLREIFAGFAALGVLSPACCAPFSEPFGTTLAEGAGFLVVERAARAAQRGARAHAAICGYGLSADAFHETTPDPSGSGIGRAVRGALLDAGWDGAEVDYVNAHATGTHSHDRSEWTALCRELSPRVAPLRVSGLKSWLGHTQGAAGAIELIASVIAAGHGALVPTLHFRGPRPGCPQDPIASPLPRAGRIGRALKVSAAFGGANAVVAFRSIAEDRASAMQVDAETVQLRQVIVADAAIVSPLGALRADELVLPEQGRVRGAAAEIDMRRIDPSINPRRLDRSARLLTAAAALCARGRRPMLRGAARERAGVFLGACRMPHDSSTRCKDSIRQGGVSAISASAFARMSVNAPAGACAMTLGLKGPSTTLSVGAGSGLLAIALAAEWLAQRRDADRLLAGALDELDPRDAEAAESAVCVLLEGADVQAPAADGPRIGVAGTGLAGPGDAATAAARALAGYPECDGVFADGEAARACLAPRVPDAARLPLGFVDVSQRWGHAEATRSALAFVLACRSLREGRANALLVVSAAGRSASVALLLRRQEVS